MAKPSLFERIGGESVVAALADLLYVKALADPRTSGFFSGMDMDGQIRKQVAFMTVAFGGPEAYRGKDLWSAHTNLVKDKGLTDEHFDAVVDHVRASLVELDVAPDVVREAMGVLEGTRHMVLGR